MVLEVRDLITLLKCQEDQRILIQSIQMHIDQANGVSIKWNWTQWHPITCFSLSLWLPSRFHRCGGGEKGLGYFCGSFIPSIVRRICYLRDANLFSRSTSTIYSTWSIILLDRLRKCDKTWSRRLNHQMSITNQVAGHRCSYHHELSQRCQKTSWESVFYADWNWLQSSVAFSGQVNFEETDL